MKKGEKRSGDLDFDPVLVFLLTQHFHTVTPKTNVTAPHESYGRRVASTLNQYQVKT